MAWWLANPHEPIPPITPTGAREASGWVVHPDRIQAEAEAFRSCGSVRRGVAPMRTSQHHSDGAGAAAVQPVGRPVTVYRYPIPDVVRWIAADRGE
jgi:hypothetical protein